jgi:hypothetical protein
METREMRCSEWRRSVGSPESVGFVISAPDLRVIRAAIVSAPSREINWDGGRARCRRPHEDAPRVESPTPVFEAVLALSTSNSKRSKASNSTCQEDRRPDFRIERQSLISRRLMVCPFIRTCSFPCILRNVVTFPFGELPPEI